MVRWLAMVVVCALATGSVAASAPGPSVAGQPEAGPQSGPDVVILAVDFVLGGRLEGLREAAAAQDIEVVWHHVESMDADQVRAQARAARLVLLDAPRGNDIGVIRAATGELLGPVRTPQLLVGAGGHQARGLDEATAAGLAAFYANPLPANTDGLWRLVASTVLGRESIVVPDPVELPEAGIFHPRLPQVVEADPRVYRDWLRERTRADGKSGDRRPAVIGIAMASSQIDSQQSALVEALIDGIEARGAQAWPFYYPWSTADGMQQVLSVEGVPQVDVVINLTHMMGVADRQAELTAMDIPLVQGFAYREGDADQWRADPDGVPMRSLPAFLAIPEQMGAQDPLVIGAQDDGRIVAIPEQVDLLLERTLRLVSLRHVPATQKRVAVMFWSYPPGERGVSASNLNLPRSLEHVLEAMAAAGYDTRTPSQEELETVLPTLLDPWQGRIDPARFAGKRPEHVMGLPLAVYQAWFDALPLEARERIQARWGEPGDDPMLVELEGERQFAIPALDLGHVVLLPQPARSRSGEGGYHDGKVPPGHSYLAAYLLVREGFAADALVHFGTHGSQEFLPGKQRGLSAHDDALLPLGDLPVIYPYISDNIAEGLQAKRRGRAVTVTHQTPSFGPAGLHGELLILHDLIHDWTMLDEGPVRARTEADAIAEAVALNIHEDLGWSEAKIAADFKGFERVLHDYLHELAADTQPLGLHAFGLAPEPGLRLSTLMQMLGEEFYEALGIEEPEELFSQAHDAFQDTAPYVFLSRFLVDGEDPEVLEDPVLRDMVVRALEYDRDLHAADEVPQLLRALEGRYLASTTGGDPIRNPGILPTGRNLFGFDPSRLPTPRAWEVGRELAEALLEDHRREAGRLPESMALSLFSSEAMRHQGVLEAQGLAMMGLAPEWDQGGRVTGFRVMDRKELGRPRVDVVFSLTGVYRDQFPQFVDHLSSAVLALSDNDEPDNPIARNSRRTREQLAAQGINGDRGRALAAIRVFSNEAGSYGSGLTDSTLDYEGWDEESELADIYLTRMQSGYGVGRDLQDVRLDGLNLFAENLRSVEGAVLSRSSNLNGLLSTDHPFEYLGGLSLAVRSLSGKSPAMYVSNLRDPQGGRMQAASLYLSGELRSRYHHPGWIQAMQGEGYAGTLELLNVVNNSFGWQVMDESMIRPDQWQDFHDIYLRDSLDLGLDEWFREHNPEALRRIVERMLETVRRDYWDAPEETLRSLVEAQLELSEGRGADGRLGEYIDELAAGFGMDVAGVATTVSGQRLEQITPPAPTAPPMPLVTLLLILAVLAPSLIGGWRQARMGSPLEPTDYASPR